MISKLFNLIKKPKNDSSNEIEKSNNYYYDNIKSYLVDNNGEILQQIGISDQFHIKKNTSVSTILKKQISIINQCEIIIKEKINGADLKTDNKIANKFIRWLNNPNCRPYPVNKSDIIKNIITKYSYYGKAGIIFVFNKEIGLNNFKCIKIAREIEIMETLNSIEYNIDIGNFNQSCIFKYDPIRQSYVSKINNEMMLLCLFENFDSDTNTYISSFDGVINYIKLQNYLGDFASSFYSNFCIPSSIVTISIDNKNINPIDLGEREIRSFEATVEKFKNEIKGASAQGKAVVINKPNMTIDIKPIQLPANAEDNISYHALCCEKIYAHIDGGNRSAFEGLNEYSNNAEIKLIDLYEGTIRLANNIILDNLNKFFINLFTNAIMLKNNEIKASEMEKIKNMYLEFDISNVKSFQKASIQEVSDLWEKNLIDLRTATNKLKTIDDSYSGIELKEQNKDKYYFDFEKQKQQIKN